MRIQNSCRSMVTVVSNQFIDQALAEAGGEYVKIYLVLLRLAQDAGEEFGTARLADCLNDTEGDVLRGLRYWEKQGWLRLAEAADGSIAEICLTDPTAAAAVGQMPGNPAAARAAQVSGNTAAASCAGQTAEAAAENGRQARADIRPVTADQMEQLRKDEDFSQFIFVAETYLGRTLTPKDVQLFAYLYDDLKFPEDLLEYLVEYCVEGGHKSCRYMESVALGWHREGKMTVQLAKESHKAFSRENKQVMKAFGITGRMLNEEERAYIEKWTKEYGLPLDVVVEACNTTVSAIQKPSFQYTDTILTDWHQAGVKTKEEAKLRRENRRNTRPQSAEPAKTAAGTRFQNYQQRNIDYDALLNQGGLNPYGKE